MIIMSMNRMILMIMINQNDCDYYNRKHNKRFNQYDTEIMTRFEYEVRIYCQSRRNLKVVKWG